jgi:hypothetical protein
MSRQNLFLVILAVIIIGSGTYWMSKDRTSAETPLTATTTTAKTVAASNSAKSTEISKKPQQSISIDKVSLSATSSQPTITGSAYGITSIELSVGIQKSSGLFDVVRARNVPVVNNRWSVTLNRGSDSMILIWSQPESEFPYSLTSGEYSISVYGGTVQAQNTLIVRVK